MFQCYIRCAVLCELYTCIYAMYLVHLYPIYLRSSHRFISSRNLECLLLVIAFCFFCPFLESVNTTKTFCGSKKNVEYRKKINAQPNGHGKTICHGNGRSMDVKADWLNFSGWRMGCLGALGNLQRHLRRWYAEEVERLRGPTTWGPGLRGPFRSMARVQHPLVPR